VGIGVATATAAEAVGRETAEERYKQLLADIRITDDISFKLLGFVPLVSGGGILASSVASLFVQSEAWSPALVFVSVFAAIVTFGFYRWERRNIQRCSWLQERAAAIEREEFGLPVGAFAGRPAAPAFLGRRIGKTQAEALIYWTTIVAWLLVPVVVAVAHSLK
jgi:hypothetical protein